jgi:hypothetical protein
VVVSSVVWEAWAGVVLVLINRPQRAPVREVVSPTKEVNKACSTGLPVIKQKARLETQTRARKAIPPTTRKITFELVCGWSITFRIKIC